MLRLTRALPCPNANGTIDAPMVTFVLPIVAFIVVIDPTPVRVIN